MYCIVLKNTGNRFTPGFFPPALKLKSKTLESGSEDGVVVMLSSRSFDCANKKWGSKFDLSSGPVRGQKNFGRSEVLPNSGLPDTGGAIFR